MIGGAIVTAPATVLFRLTRPVAGMFSEEGSASAACSVVESILLAHQYSALTVWLAILAIYVMDFSTNVGTCSMDSRYISPAEFPP